MNRMLTQTALCLLATLALSVAGCSNNKPATEIPTNAQVTDISPVAPTAAPMPVASAQPVYSQQPVTPVAMNMPAANAGGSTYTVQKGDTLCKIAREHYGNASAWKKIAAANPGSETIIKPGQQLVLP